MLNEPLELYSVDIIYLVFSWSYNTALFKLESRLTISNSLEVRLPWFSSGNLLAIWFLNVIPCFHFLVRTVCYL